MALATVNADIAPVYERPDHAATRLDEVLYGMSVNLVQELDNAFCYVVSEYASEGYMPSSCLETDSEVAAAWRRYSKEIVLAPYIDVNFAPDIRSGRMVSLPRGGILVPLGETPDGGWQKVGMTGGQVGYTRASYLGKIIEDWQSLAQADMRWNLVETALSYNGTAWRTGGRTSLGIDEVGLAAMVYYLNGAQIPRARHFSTGGLLKLIDSKSLSEGDLIFFNDSVGIYIGEGKYIHSTDFEGCEGVIINSLRPKDDDYRQDLAAGIAALASLY